MPERSNPGTVAATALRTAQILIERHGEGALAFAKAQAQQLARSGADASAADWRAVVAAIESLLAAKSKK
jgi:hypothetical protein